MVEHICATCGKVFKQKVHLDNHKKRKRPCKNGQTQIVTNPSVVKHVETKPLSWYAEKMPDIFRFVTRDIHLNVMRGETDIIIPAQVKTGKRFIAQAYSAFTTPIVGEKTAHVFISAWVRRDDDNQRKMLNAYFQGTKSNPRVFKINTERASVKCKEELEKIVETHDRTIVTLDELDYGSGSEQHMAAVYEYCMSQEKITLISYSASYEEATIAPVINSTGAKKPIVLPFTPPAEYRGAKWYCENKLVFEAEPFFDISGEDISVSVSAKALLERAKARLSSENPKESRRKLLIVRQTTAFEAIKKKIDEEAFPELCGNDDIRILPHFIHSRLPSMTVLWDNYTWWKRRMEVEHGPGKFLLILFIDQSSTRSTDWFCHPWLSAYHDYHPAETPVNTCIQANLRIVYYTNKMCEGVKVYEDEEFFPEVHGQKEVIEYVAGIKNLGQMTRPVTSRTKIFEHLKTFGPILTATFTSEELARLPLEGRLTDETRQIVQAAILDKLKPAERRILGERTLHNRRKYTTGDDDLICIHTLAANKARNINCGPVRSGGGYFGGAIGGGGAGGELYKNRGKYFWADFALDELQTTCEGKVIKISKGTVFITHGIPDPILEDDSSTVSSGEDNEHRVTQKSMYAPQPPKPPKAPKARKAQT